MILTLRTRLDLGVRHAFEVEGFIETRSAVVKSYTTNAPRSGFVMLQSLYVGAEDMLDGEERDALLVSPAGVEVPAIYGTRIALYGYYTGVVIPGLQVAPGDEFGTFTFEVSLF